VLNTLVYIALVIIVIIVIVVLLRFLFWRPLHDTNKLRSSSRYARIHKRYFEYRNKLRNKLKEKETGTVLFATVGNCDKTLELRSILFCTLSYNA
jgi:hypothetical protein